MQKSKTKKYPRLLADIGGTNARFALETSPGHIEAIKVYSNKLFRGLEQALQVFFSEPEAVHAGSGSVKHAAIAIANPIIGDLIKMTNSSWVFSIQKVQQQFGFESFLVVNDFTALAMAIPFLKPEEKIQWGGKVPAINQAIGLLGAGTGLGVSGLIPVGGQWTALETEGGHVSFSPFDEREIELLRLAQKQISHISAERFISGMGLELIYSLLASSRNLNPEELSAIEITSQALNNENDLCDEVIEIFSLMLGTAAANLALTLGAKGGIYIGGGIVPRLGERFFKSGFRQRFEQKGRFSDYLSNIPVFVITDTYAALAGVSALLSNYLEN